MVGDVSPLKTARYVIHFSWLQNSICLANVSFEMISRPVFSRCPGRPFMAEFAKKVHDVVADQGTIWQVAFSQNCVSLEGWCHECCWNVKSNAVCIIFNWLYPCLSWLKGIPSPWFMDNSAWPSSTLFPITHTDILLIQISRNISIMNGSKGYPIYSSLLKVQ